MKNSPKNPVRIHASFGEKEFMDEFLAELRRQNEAGQSSQKEAIRILRRSGILNARGKLAKPYAA